MLKRRVQPYAMLKSNVTPIPPKSYTHIHASTPSRALLQLGSLRRVSLSSPSHLPLLDHILDKRLSCLVTRPNQRPGRAVQETHIQRALPPHLKHIRRHVLVHGHVSLRRTHVLSKRDNIDAVRPEILERLPQLLLLLAEAQHDARLGDELGVRLLGDAQHVERLAEVRAAVAHVRRQALGGLDVVREDVEARVCDELDHFRIAGVVADQGFDEHGGRFLLDLHDCLDGVARAAIGQVVAVHDGEHHVAQAPSAEGLGGVFGLVGVEGWRGTRRLDGAEAAAARARVAAQHDGGCCGGFVAAAPAVADVWAFCLFADGVQVQAAEVLFDLLVVCIRGDWCLEPFRQSCDGLLAAFWAHFDGLDFVGLGG
jgi:hypothetical protein